MDLFVFDTAGDENLLDKKCSRFAEATSECVTAEANVTWASDQKDEEGCVELSTSERELVSFVKSAISSYDDKSKRTPAKKSNNYDDFAESMGWPTGAFQKQHGRSARNISIMDNEAIELIRRSKEDLLKNETLHAIEKKKSIECPSKQQLAKKNKAERAKTKGKEWFNIPAPEVTEELENDLKVLQMRSALDPKHFYKRNTLKVLPKYFQVGTVLHSPLDYFNERDERKGKKRSLVDELIADAEFQKFNKRKYKEVMEQRRKTGYHKANKKMNKLKKKK